MTWRTAVEALRAQGFDVLDWLSAVEESDAVIVTACLVRSEEPREYRLVRAAAPVPSLVDLFPSAAWHERETAEMFGVTFEGHPDPRPLLLPEPSAPLRKQDPLAARLEPWPGAVDPAKPSRSQRPPGTPWQ